MMRSLARTAEDCVVAIGLLWLVAWIAGSFLAKPAAAQEGVGIVNPDSAMKTISTSYTTSYDRDRSRGLWTQSLTYGTSSKRSSFNASGFITTQDFMKSASKSTLGSIDGTLNIQLVGRLLAIVTGSFDMNSSKDGQSGIDSRDNRINVRAQYLFAPVRGMSTTLSAYTEFEQKHDRTRTDSPKFSDEFDDPARVDSTVAQRDSSYTSSRMDGITGENSWNVRPWLTLRTTGQWYRMHPTIRSFSRTFVNPNDASGGGYIRDSLEVTSNPTGNTSFTQRASFTRLRMTRIDFYGERRNLEQSYFDKQRSDQETVKIDNNVGTLHIDSSILPRFVFYLDATVGRALNEYELNTNRTQLTRNQKVFSTVNYADSSWRASVNATVDRSRTELNPSVSGLEISRNVGANAWMRTSRKLALDLLASASLLSNDYERDESDRDVQRTLLSLGGGYLLAPACSTTVHFTRSSGHTVNLDPSLSGGNAVTTTYQMNATMQYVPNRDFYIRQSYVLSAEYRILDYAEFQNSLRRVRRIDTDVADTLFSRAFVRLTHNFVFQDQGTYAHFEGSANRRYRAASRSYDQTLTATAGFKLIPGLLFTATQSLLNNRTKNLAANTTSLQNTWKLNLGLLVYRTLEDGLGINGAVRRIEEYVENNQAIEPRHDWVAAVSIHKDF